jgi:hypothetical protein
VSGVDLIPIVLLIPLSIALVSGTTIVLCIFRWRRYQASFGTISPPYDFDLCENSGTTAFINRPPSWITVRTCDLASVQSALGISNAHPCPLTQGLVTDQQLFIAPPVNGWILLTGSGLPDPAEDVDQCFKFLVELSRQLGQVQFFSANRVLGHHAWAWAQSGRIVRAYAWAAKTLWNQGIKTRAELELGLHCFQYLETFEQTTFSQPEVITTNAEKVPLLAARWSLDPGSIDEYTLEHAQGIAGEARRLC